MRRRWAVDLAASIGFCVSLIFGAICTAAAQDAVRVASKIDTEGALLGNMIIQLLDAGGIKTVNKLRLGPTNIVRSAIIAGEIDIYPEYTGNGALFYSSTTDPVWKSAAAGYDKIRSLDRSTHNLVWLPPAHANNSWVIAVRQDLAGANHLATMEDFARWVRDGGDLKLAASAEFVESPAALPAFEATYGFKPRAAQLVVLAGGDTAVTIRAAAQRTSGVNSAMAYGTDGALAALGLVVMADSKSAQVVYAPAPVVRGAVLDRFPAIADRLAPVFRSLDEMVLRDLNAKIAVEGEEASQVAAAYLRSKGFLN